jgi:hypothetical protein
MVGARDFDPENPDQSPHVCFGEPKMRNYLGKFCRPAQFIADSNWSSTQDRIGFASAPATQWRRPAKLGIVTGALNNYIARVRSFGLACLCPIGTPQDSAEFGFATARSGGCKGIYAFFRRREWRLAQ